ncbi:unnamed protein product [Ilex paraguariensis]|uniref:Transcription factor TFIIB cyclin-like domain-containing protein n=1 Tax=Ilex paraguariensis TaxID=185542 RepID=A0ABC8RL55_9AQUA
MDPYDTPFLIDDQKCTRGRNLDCLVAACIYIACRQEGKPRTVKDIIYVDISIASTVAEVTVKNAYKDLCPHASRIIPERYAKEKDLENLCYPKT